MKEFIGICIDNPFKSIEKLTDVIDAGIEISIRTFKNLCDVSEKEFQMFKKYPNDFRFYKTKDIYFYQWSAIEHFYR